MNRGLVVNRIAGVRVEPHRIVKHHSTDGAMVSAATAGADKSIGITDTGANPGTRVDVILSGVADVTYGDAVAAGDKLTAGANGKAVPAQAGNRSIGIAMCAGIAGDIGEVLLSQS